MQARGFNGGPAVPLVRIEEMYESESEVSERQSAPGPPDGRESGREGCYTLLRSYEDLQVQDLQAKEAEIRELRHVIAMKDHIIRSLGEEIGSAEVAAQVISMKDHVIRTLQEELEETKHSFWECSGAMVEQAAMFTALPVAESTAYIPVPGNLLDQRIADFSNGRRNLVMFTRLKEEGFYLFGRMLVQCFTSNRARHYQAGVLVQELDSEEVYDIEDFMERFERFEHQQLEQHFLAAAQGTTTGMEPVTRLNHGP
ncbi:unnamed protein product [Symbiodinium natans]|uniref:Uncharacterized protein n=1 Tax=Symbiodinium natans TaxID=878477 RepID=A0A812LGZ3_9DINO|nr:unnamed protein product [Symbiodinium natans]